MNCFDIMLQRLLGGETDPTGFESDVVINDFIKEKQLGRTDSFLQVIGKLVSDKGNDLNGSEMSEVINRLFGGVALDTYTFRQSIAERVARYKEYDAIVKKIPYAKRALNVITSEVLAPDSITDSNFNIKKIKDIIDKEKESELKRNIVEILESLNIKKEMKGVVKGACKYGDSFVEVINMKNELKTKGVLVESCSLCLDESVGNAKIDLRICETPFDKISILVEEEEIGKQIVGKAKQQENDEKQNEKISLDDILLIKHNPGLVVRIGEEVCFGYIIFPKEILNAPKIENNILYKAANNNNMKEFLRKIKGYLAHNKKIADEIDNNRDLKIMITKLYLFYNETNQGNTLGNANAEMRFVPPDLMFHFKNESDEFEPFGESIFANQEFDAKIIVLFKIAMTLMRLTRSTEKRLIALETGLEKNVRNIIERWRELYERRKFSIADTGSIDSVPSLITTFEDIFVPMKDGKRYVEFDTIPPPAGLDAKTDDYKAMRDSFVAGLYVSPPYLAIEEKIESRATLSHENIMFAKAIINYQKNFETTLNQMIRSIYKMVYYDECSSMEVTFPRPRSSELTRESEYFTALKDFKSVVKELELSEEKFIQKYIDSELLEKTEKDLEREIEENEGSEEPTTEF